MRKVKEYLHSLNIVYIDWKPDNIGLTTDNKKTVKLYDFDASGIVEKDENGTLKWKIKPPEWFFYRVAIEKGIADPFEIDDYIFENEFIV
jgi:serine/threonine protein kinase